MERIKYDMGLMKTMSLFEKVTRTSLKDCFVDKNNLLVFVVDSDKISRAIGREGSNVKRLEKLLNRKIKILGYTPEIEQFVRNVLYPVRVKGIREEEGIISLEGSDMRTRGLLIGKNAQNLKNSLWIVKRYFNNIKEIKVI
jgi:N utilization substance protein A